jgi:uncharacterized repeat protein (TIGR03803 family)
MKKLCMVAAVCFLCALSNAYAQTVGDVFSYSDELGLGSITLAQGRDGRLYGTSSGNGSSVNPDGTIFAVNTNGSAVSVLSSFDGSDGQSPFYGVTLALDGNYYGTTYEGGSSNAGVLFKVAPTGVYTPLYQFTNGSDGGFPAGPPIQASDGNLYGVTMTDDQEEATVYRYVPSTASLTTILSLGPDFSQGAGISAPLIQASDGTLYGTATTGGANNCGTIFRLTTAGVLLSVYSFPCLSGGYGPIAPLLQASDGNLYGTTSVGGKVNSRYCANGCGTIFRVSHGIVTVIYRFAGYPNDGGVATTGLVEGTDGNLYGATARGGTNNIGTLYQITTGGQYKLLYSFSSSIGDGPGSSLMQHTNGMFYGTTSAGGQNSLGTIYSLNMGLSPFIALVRYAGRIGQPVQILGQGLTGSTGVTINGTAASSFKVVSDTYMTAVIPAGATTGPVVVTTPGGTLTSNHNLQIVQ